MTCARPYKSVRAGKASARAPRQRVAGATMRAVGQLRPAGELSLLFCAAACGLGLYARVNQAATAKTMPATSEPVAFSGWCPAEPLMCPGMKLGSDLAGSAR